MTVPRAAVYTGRSGRGNRSVYTLLLDTETPAKERALAKHVKARAQRPKKPAPQPGRIDRRGKAAEKPHKTLPTLAVDAYCGSCGSLELAEWRGSLVRQVKDLAAAGTEERIVLAACSSLGKERAFPGYLKQRVSELEEAGGPCERDGLDPSKLSLAELQDAAVPSARSGRSTGESRSKILPSESLIDYHGRALGAFEFRRISKLQCAPGGLHPHEAAGATDERPERRCDGDSFAAHCGGGCASCFGGHIRGESKGIGCSSPIGSNQTPPWMPTPWRFARVWDSQRDSSSHD
jgi:hypothetical protein